MRKKEYVSNVITANVIDKLEVGKNYLIASEMDSGKNYWVRNVLLPYALDKRKRTLVLSHRSSTLSQQKNYLEEYKWECIRQFKGGMFDLKTYQAFQNMLKRNDPSVDDYDYIVCDEAHYFVSDSTFNTKTELAFNYLNQNHKAVKFFLTATPEGLYYLPWKNEIKVLKEANFANNSVKDLYRYEKDETASAAITNEVEKGNKVIVYHNSMNTLSDFSIGNSKILYSGNRNFSDEYNQITDTCQFDCDVLNTTKLMTEATEIKDDLVESIVIPWHKLY